MFTFNDQRHNKFIVIKVVGNIVNVLAKTLTKSLDVLRSMLPK